MIISYITTVCFVLCVYFLFKKHLKEFFMNHFKGSIFTERELVFAFLSALWLIVYSIKGVLKLWQVM